MSDNFNVLTNTNYLVDVLRKSIDEANKCESGVTTRKSKKDGNGDETQILQLSPEQLFNILSIKVNFCYLDEQILIAGVRIISNIILLYFLGILSCTFYV